MTGCSVAETGVCVTYLLHGLRLDEARMIVAGELPACEECHARAVDMIETDAAWEFPASHVELLGKLAGMTQ